MSISIASLFSGCGGLDLGFDRAGGYQVVWANDEVDDFCNTYEKNLGIKPLCKDIREVSKSDIPSANIIVGGPPCQSFSLLGKRSSDDERGSLVWDYLEAIKEVEPQVFLFENVTGLRSAKTPEGNLVINELQEAFEKLGYHVEIHLLNAADYGVPQKRRRVFIVGSASGDKIPAPSPTHSEKGEDLPRWVTAHEAISDLPKPSDEERLAYKSKPKSLFQKEMRKKSQGVYNHYPPYSSERDMKIIKSVTPGGNYQDVPDSIATKRIMKFKETGGRTTTYGRLHPEQTPYTINTYFSRPNVGCNIHYEQDRLITLREGLRIQSFPDDFILTSSTKRNYYNQVGNAVPPLLAEKWARHLKKFLQ